MKTDAAEKLPGCVAQRVRPTITPTHSAASLRRLGPKQKRPEAIARAPGVGVYQKKTEIAGAGCFQPAATAALAFAKSTMSKMC